MLIVLACILGLLYLTQVTKTNAFGYRIENLKEQKTTLQQEHDALEVAAARLQSIERVKNSAVARLWFSSSKRQRSKLEELMQPDSKQSRPAVTALHRVRLWY